MSFFDKKIPEKIDRLPELAYQPLVELDSRSTQSCLSGWTIRFGDEPSTTPCKCFTK